MFPGADVFICIFGQVHCVWIVFVSKKKTTCHKYLSEFTVYQKLDVRNVIKHFKSRHAVVLEKRNY